MVTCFDVCEILEMLSEASVKVFLDGGWGVDALIGRETRIHNDIDLFVEKKDYCITISVITGKGYREVIMDYTTDSHTVWKDYNGRIIDLHSFEYVEDGILYEGYTFPSDTFSGKGNIGNIEVTCINPEAQVQFHLGYEYDENDVHDVLLLCRTFNLEIPELGVGGNTPVIIKYPFWAMTAENPRAVYACLNRSAAVCPRVIEDRSICIDGDTGEVLKRLL